MRSLLMGLKAFSYILHFYTFMNNETYKHIKKSGGALKVSQIQIDFLLF